VSNLHSLVVSQDVFDYLQLSVDYPVATNKRHELKIINPYYTQVTTNQKQFELRLNDRGFSVGDTLVLREYDLVRKSYGGWQMRQVYHKRHDPLLENDHLILDMGTTFKTLIWDLNRVFNIGDRLEITCDEYLYESIVKHIYFKLDYGTGVGMKPYTVALSVA
jgi:hypothetical protein